MVEPPPRLHVSGNVGIKNLPFGGDPVDDGALHPLRVVGPSPVGTFLDLEILLLRHEFLVLTENRSLNQ